MKNKQIKILTILAPFLWFLILFSGSLFMAHWRIVNEPGIVASAYLSLKIMAQILLMVGLIGTSGITYLFYTHKQTLKTILTLNILATFIYIPIFFLTLLLMV